MWSNEHFGRLEHILMKLMIAHCSVHMTLMTFSRSWIQRSRSQPIFSKNAFFEWRHTNQRFAIEDHLVAGSFSVNFRNI